MISASVPRTAAPWQVLRRCHGGNSGGHWPRGQGVAVRVIPLGRNGWMENQWEIGGYDMDRSSDYGYMDIINLWIIYIYIYISD